MLDPITFYKCLADETRLKCLLLIQLEGELCVCELMQALDDSQPKISRHLAQLRECGLLRDTRRGKWVYYHIHPELDEWAKLVLQHTQQSQMGFLKGSIDNLCCMTDRPTATSNNSCC